MRYAIGYRGTVWLWPLLALAITMLASPVRAQDGDWRQYRLGTVSVSAPADWRVLYRQPGTEVQLGARDDSYSLSVFWWRVDEPLLGYDDIVSHEEFTLAGRRAMLIRSEFPNVGVLQVAFLDPREDGKKLLVKLDFPDKDFERASALLDRLLARLSYDGQTGGASKRFGPAPPDREEIAAAGRPMPGMTPVGGILRTAIDNVGAVRNGPRNPSHIDAAEPIHIVSIRTYHWNGGRGAAPGTVALRNAAGQIFGPWQAIGLPGSGGVANAYWRVEPGITVPAGRYEVVDSDPGTWATNAQASDRGFVVVEYRRAVPATPTGRRDPVKEPVAKDRGPQEGDAAGGDATLPESLATAGEAGETEPERTDRTDGTLKTDKTEPKDTTDKSDADTSVALFDGRMEKPWVEASIAGGNFGAFARVGADGLTVDVPRGNNWGKTGIRSAVPVVTLDKPGKAQVLRFVLRPEDTSGFVIALAQSDSADDWWGHDVRFGWYRSPDGKSAVAHLHVHRQVVREIRMGPDAPDEVTLQIGPRGAVVVTLPDGTMIETTIPNAAGIKGYHVFAIAHPFTANEPVRLGLRRIEMKTVPAREPATRPYPDMRDRIVLFDGLLGADWVPHSAAGGDFNRHARTTGTELIVDVPAGSHHGRVGILSPLPLVWLQDLNGEAEVEVTFHIDPDRSDGFLLALAHPGAGGIYGNGPGTPSVEYSFYRPKDAEGALADIHFRPHKGQDFDRREVAARPPSEIRFTIRPGTVTVSAEGMEPVTRPFPAATNGAGLHVYAHSIVPEVEAPTRFVLTRITVSRKGMTRAPASRPAAGVLPLAVRTIFAGAPDPLWEPIGVAGGNFEKFARYAGGALVVDVPKGNGWGKTGLLSTSPIVNLDLRQYRAPSFIELHLDPSVPQFLNVALSTRKVADMWADHSAWYTLSYVPDRNIWVMGVRRSPYHAWYREIDPAWMMKHWDGRVRIELADGWTTISLPGGPLVRGTTSLGSYAGLFAVVQAHPPGDGKAAHLTLRKITTGLVAPPGMTNVERWQLVDDKDFDPKALLEDIAAQMDWPVSAEIEE